MPTLNRQNCIVDTYPEAVWAEYTMRITHWPTGISVQGNGNLVDDTHPLSDRLFEELAELVESRMLEEAASTATDFLTLDELTTDYEAHHGGAEGLTECRR